MNHAFMEEWAEALLSGDYTQGKGVLYNSTNNTYCCLGVACDVLAKRGEIVEREGEFFSTKDGSDGSYSALPQGVAQYIGVTELGQLQEDHEVCLTNLNDGTIHDPYSGIVKEFESSSFEDIANLLYQEINQGDVFVETYLKKEEV